MPLVGRLRPPRGAKAQRTADAGPEDRPWETTRSVLGGASYT